MDLAALHRLCSADQVYAYAAENRPHIRAERLRLESSEHAVAVARSALSSSLSLSGGYGTGVYSAEQE
ncbi:MAG: TolC family protein [Alistipes senegalensis]